MTTWNILGTTEHVALGELQQDGGVDGELTDGGMSYTDNATNSPEQSTALQNWVERFDHEMTQGVDGETAMSKLADLGCPNPQAVAQMWKHQQENPETTEDLTETTPPEDPTMTPAPQDLAAQGQQPLASTKKTADISPDVAHFHSLLQGGVDPEKIYNAFPQMHPLIDEAVAQHGGGTPPIVNETPVQNLSRDELNADVSNSVQQLRDTVNPGAKERRNPDRGRFQGLGSTKEAGPNHDFNMPNADDLGETGGVLTDPGLTPEAPLATAPASTDPHGDIAAMAQEMNDLGWTGDAQEWLDEVDNYHDEDLPMLVEDMRAQLEQMRARETERSPYPGDDLDEHVGQEPESDLLDGAEWAPGTGPTHAKTADLAGKGPRRDKANEIYKAIRRDDPDKDKSSAAAIANDEANDLEKKGDLGLGNDKDEKKKDDKSDKDSDSKDDKKDDKGKPPWLKKKDSRASYQGLNGVVSAVFQDVWSTKPMAILSTEHGDLTVPADELEAPAAQETDNPVQEINDFLGIIDPAGHIPASFHARIENLSQVVREARKVIAANKVSIADQMALDEIVIKSAAEIQELTKLAEEFVSEGDQAYLDAQPEFGIGAGGVGATESMGGNDAGGWLDETYHDMMSDLTAVDYDKVVAEEPALLVSDMPDVVLGDQGAAQELATSYISAKVAGLPEKIRNEIRTAFVTKTEHCRRAALAQRKASMKKAAATMVEADGPAEGLFY